MNDKPKLRDKFYSVPPSANEGAKPASPNNGEQRKKESLEQILEDGFKAEMKGLKTGCLLVWHIGGLLILLLIIFIGLATIYSLIFG